MTQQYTTGSVTVTNGDATVTGTGTDWQNAGITTGDWLIVQGDAIGYRVNSVTSNTELELSEPYAGTSGTYSDYAISREFTPNLALVEMSPKSIGSAQAYNESMGIIDQEVGNRYTKTEADARYLQEASNLSDLDNDATARTNLDVYSKGEADGRYLNEASNLSDLDSASTARGNLGLGTAATADTTTGPSDTTSGRVPLLPYAYTRANILGTVSQSGGVPTGAIIERGSNSHGEYVKFADGTAIQTRTLTVDFATENTLEGSWSFPVNFLADPYSLNVNLRENAGSAVSNGNTTDLGAIDFSSLSNSSTAVRVSRVAGSADPFVSGDNTEISLVAIGPWY